MPVSCSLIDIPFVDDNINLGMSLACQKSQYTFSLAKGQLFLPLTIVINIMPYFKTPENAKKSK